MAATPSQPDISFSATTTAKPVTYLQGHHPSVLRSHRARTAANSCPHLLPHLRPGMRVLDVGCGPGTITCDLAAIVGNASPSNDSTIPAGGGHVTGIDYSAAVLASARAHAQQAGVRNVTFVEADLYALPFADGAFDAVLAHQVVQHVADPVRAVREMRRVARPGGGVVALREGDAQVWFPDCGTEGDEGHGEAPPGVVLKEWYALWRRMAQAGGMETNSGRRLKSYALAAGFGEGEVVRAGVGSQCWATKEELREWCGMWAERVLVSEFAEKAVAGGYATKEELERMAEAWRKFPEIEGAWYGMLQGEAVLKRADGEK